jgi:hypothetical protein
MFFDSRCRWVKCCFYHFTLKNENSKLINKKKLYKGSKINVLKIIGAFLHDDTITHQLYINGFNNLFYV